MPSRRQLLGGLGTVLASGLAGCATEQTTTGTVGHKKVSVEVPRTAGRPIEVTLALLTYEPDRHLVTGEYADIVPELINGPSLSVSDMVKDRLADRFLSIRFYANILPTDSSPPVNGQLTRTAFNSLSIGATATVDPTMKQVDSSHSVRHLRVETASNQDQQPAKARVSQYRWDKRLNNILAESRR